MPGLASRATAACALSGSLLCLSLSLAARAVSAEADHTTRTGILACPRDPVPAGWTLETQPAGIAEPWSGLPCSRVVLPLGRTELRQRWCSGSDCGPWSEPALVVRHGCPTDSTADGMSGGSDFVALARAWGACE